MPGGAAKGGETADMRAVRGQSKRDGSRQHGDGFLTLGVVIAETGNQ